MTLASEKLTNNQQTVLDLLEKSKEPLKAYAILFDIQKKGIKAPLQVYRAACEHKNCDSSTSTSFLICETCDQVTELKKKNLSEYFAKQSVQANFKYAKHNLEIYGVCKDCKNKK